MSSGYRKFTQVSLKMENFELDRFFVRCSNNSTTISLVQSSYLEVDKIMNWITQELVFPKCHRVSIYSSSLF